MKMMEADIRTSRRRLPIIGQDLAAFVYMTARIIIGLSRMTKLGGTPQIPIARNQEEESGPGKEERVGLGWKDYLALAIASLETVLLPLVLLVIVILALVLLLR